MRRIKIIIEKHKDGYVSYPIGLKGVVVGEGDTYEEALLDVRSAIRFHIKTFGEEVLKPESREYGIARSPVHGAFAERLGQPLTAGYRASQIL